MRMPRKLVSNSTIDPATGNICMRRSDPWINNFNEYLIAACRSNMDIKFIWSGSDAKALVYYITDYVTKTSLSFHDTFSLVQKSITSVQNLWNQTNNESAIEKSRKLVLRCYNMLASQQELSGVQVASYLMNWDDHYTTHRFQDLFLIQTERFLQAQLNETRAQQKLETAAQNVIDNDIYDDEAIDNDNNDEEHFQIQSTEHDKKYVLVNIRIDFQYRSDNLNRLCLYDFVSIFYKKKMNSTDLKYLSKIAGSIEEKINQKGRPPNERFLFQKQHPQATTYLMMKYSESHVPVLYGPQIPRQDRDDTRERYCRAILTLFVSWRTVTDICDISQTWEDAFKSRQHLILSNSWTIIENIQLLHECKKDRDDHLLQVIAEAQTDNGLVDPVLIPTNQVDGEYGIDDSDDLLELLGNLDENTVAMSNATKNSTENRYIEETIEAVKNVGRFNSVNNNDVMLNLDTARSAVASVVTLNNINTKTYENYGSIPPVISVKTNSCTQKSVADEFTLNREQRAVFMIITGHLDGDSLCRTGNLYKSSRHILKYIIFSGDNNGQLIMCIPGCGGTGKSQLIPPTGIAAAEIDDITIHSFLGEQRNPGKARTIKPGDLKLEKEWALVEYLLIDEISMVGLTLLAKLNRIICAAKHTDPQVPFGGVNVIFFGDYLQYRPVYDVPLHTDFTLPVKSKSNKTPTEKQIQQRVARSLILQINCVVKLTQQMRTEDLRYLQLLERLRHGERNYDDYELLLTRVVGQSSVPLLSDSPWNKAPILVFRNEVRTQLNHKAVSHKAEQMGQAPIVCVAQDTCKGKPIEDRALIKKFLELSDSKTEHLPGLLPLVPGTPVILTQNIAIELGLINGVNGIFRQLVYQEDSVSTDIISEEFSKSARYVHRPLYAL
ncbi:unnamed protein product, partial [Rotaria sp. Silwood2]